MLLPTVLLEGNLLSLKLEDVFFYSSGTIISGQMQSSMPCCYVSKVLKKCSYCKILKELLRDVLDVIL